MKLYRSSLPWPQHGGSVWIRLTYPVIFKSFTVPSQRMNISEFVKRVYLCLFYTPNGWSSKRCVENLHQWTKRTRKQLSFAINMVWQEQKNHVDDCYFCLTKTSSMACTPPAPPPPPQHHLEFQLKFPRMKFFLMHPGNWSIFWGRF